MAYGLTYYYKGDYDKAIDYYKRNLEIRYNLKDKARAAISLNELGVIYYYMEDYSTSIDYIEKAIEYRRILGNKVDLISLI